MQSISLYLCFFEICFDGQNDLTYRIPTLNFHLNHKQTLYFLFFKISIKFMHYAMEL